MNLNGLNGLLFTQARGSDEKNHGNGNGRWRRIGSAYVPHNIPEICSISHTDYRVRLYAKFYAKCNRLNVSC